MISSSLTIIAKVPNTIHGSQTHHRSVEFEEVGKTGAFQSCFCSILGPPKRIVDPTTYKTHYTVVKCVCS